MLTKLNITEKNFFLHLMKKLKCIWKLSFEAFNGKALEFSFSSFTSIYFTFLNLLEGSAEWLLNSRNFLPSNYLIKITDKTFGLCECVIWQNYNNIMEAITLVKDNWAKNSVHELCSATFLMWTLHSDIIFQANKFP